MDNINKELKDFSISQKSKYVYAKGKKNKKFNRKPKNTLSFNTNFPRPNMSMQNINTEELLIHKHSVDDVIIVNNFMKRKCDDYDLFLKLSKELEDINERGLQLLWHGDKHLICSDKFKNGEWKKKLPTFQQVISEMCEMFNVEPKATRLNIYEPSHSKALHFDAKKFNPNMEQNITIGMSLGEKRILTLENAKNKTIIDIPLSNNSVYSFGERVNDTWRHGIRENKSKSSKMKRISIIIWGKVETIDKK